MKDPRPTWKRSRTLWTPKSDRFQILARLGVTDANVIYKAIDKVLNREIALKTSALPPELFPEINSHLFIEAEHQASVSHANVVTVYDVIDAKGQVCIVMEYVPGTTLQKRLRYRKPLTDAERVSFCLQLAGALSGIHTAGRIHRDIKTANILVTRGGILKLTDFGLAIDWREMSASDDGAPPVGTAACMSPEQCRNERLDPRSDIFSYGALCLEILTGVHPFRRCSYADTLDAVRNEPPRHPTTSQSQAVLEILYRCIEKHPDNRFETMKQVERGLIAAFNRSHARVAPDLLSVIEAEPIPVRSEYRASILKAGVAVPA